MKNGLLLLLLLLLNLTSFSQLVAKIHLKEPIESICDNENIYSLMSYQEGQVQADPGRTKSQIETDLNQSIKYLDNNPKFKGKGFVSIITNCKGELLSVSAQFFKKRNPAFEKELVEYFKLIELWKPGTYYKKEVDSGRTYSFKVKKGELILY